MASIVAAIPAVIGGIASGISSGQQAGSTGRVSGLLTNYLAQGNDAVNFLDQAVGGAGPAGQQMALNRFQSSPGYQWQLQQGIDAIQNSASAQGGVVSGNTLKALQTYGQGLANQDWYNYLGTLQNLANLGLGASTGAGNLTAGQGNAQAAGTVGIANNLTNLIPFLFGGGGGGSSIAPLNSTIAGGSNLLTGAGADPSAVFGTGGLGF